MSHHRVPYVGEGPDGCRRSAEIDRSEAETLPTGPHQPGWFELNAEKQRAELLASAARWEQQAAELSTV